MTVDDIFDERAETLAEARLQEGAQDAGERQRLGPLVEDFVHGLGWLSLTLGFWPRIWRQRSTITPGEPWVF